MLNKANSRLVADRKEEEEKTKGQKEGRTEQVLEVKRSTTGSLYPDLALLTDGWVHPANKVIRWSVLKCLLDQNHCIPSCQMCYRAVSLKYKFHARDRWNIHIQLLWISCPATFRWPISQACFWYSNSSHPFQVELVLCKHIPQFFNAHLKGLCIYASEVD